MMKEGKELIENLMGGNVRGVVVDKPNEFLYGDYATPILGTNRIALSYIHLAKNNPNSPVMLVRIRTQQFLNVPIYKKNEVQTVLNKMQNSQNNTDTKRIEFYIDSDNDIRISYDSLYTYDNNIASYLAIQVVVLGTVLGQLYQELKVLDLNDKTIIMR